MSGQITLETTQNVDLQLQVAPLGERVLACLIDAFIRGAIVFAVVIVFSWVMSLVSPPRIIVIGLVIVGIVPAVFYHLLFEIFNNGQSPGKKLFDLRVVALQSEQVSLGAYLLRWLFRLVDFHLFSGIVAVIAVAASDKSQRIGDMVAGTTVIKEQRRVHFRQLAYDRVTEAYVPVYPGARNLSPVHIELIKETLDNLDLDTHEHHVALLAEKTAKMLNVEFSEHPRKFLRTVVHDYSGSSRMFEG